MHVKAPFAALLLFVAGCVSTPPDTSSASMLTIDHALLPAAAEVGGPVAAYAGFENRGPGIACWASIATARPRWNCTPSFVTASRCG